MKIKVFKPTGWDYKRNKIPHIRLYGSWLRECGFEPDNYFYIEYRADEVILRLQQTSNSLIYDQNINRGKVFGVALKNSVRPMITRSSIMFKDIGFNLGISAIAEYEYGFIRLIPLETEDAKIMTVSSNRAKKRALPTANIHLSGNLLVNAGFTVNKLVHIDYDYGRIRLKVCGESNEDYLKIRKTILTNRKGSLITVKQMLSVRTKKYYPFVDINDSWFEAMGFIEGTPIIIKSEYGIIDISILDLKTARKRASSPIT